MLGYGPLAFHYPLAATTQVSRFVVCCSTKPRSLPRLVCYYYYTLPVFPRPPLTVVPLIFLPLTFLDGIHPYLPHCQLRASLSLDRSAENHGLRTLCHAHVTATLLTCAPRSRTPHALVADARFTPSSSRPSSSTASTHTPCRSFLGQPISHILLSILHSF